MRSKSSARIKRRYVLISADSKDEIEKLILDYIGVLGWAKASPSFIKSNTDRFILSVNREEINNIKASLELSNSNIKILKISGTLKGLST